MEELNRKRIDRAVLVGLNADCFTKEETATETTLDELEALLNTAGGECAGKVLQNKHTPDPRSFIGEGKAEEVRQLHPITQSLPCRSRRIPYTDFSSNLLFNSVSLRTIPFV